jgi:hypothetical protein
MDIKVGGKWADYAAAPSFASQLWACFITKDEVRRMKDEKDQELRSWFLIFFSLQPSAFILCFSLIVEAHPYQRLEEDSDVTDQFVIAEQGEDYECRCEDCGSIFWM